MLKWLFGWGGSKRPLALDHFAFYDNYKDGNWVYNCYSGMVAFGALPGREDMLRQRFQTFDQVYAATRPLLQRELKAIYDARMEAGLPLDAPCTKKEQIAFEKRVRAAFEYMGFEVKELQKPWIREKVDPEMI